MIDLWHLTNLNWMSHLAGPTAENLRQSAECRNFAVGEQVFGPDSAPDVVFVLESGMVRIYRVSAAAEEVTFGYIQPGEIFGESALFHAQPRESQAVAVEPAVVLILKRDAFLAVMREAPAIGFSVSMQIEGRFKSIETRVEDLVFRSAHNRLAHILLQLARQFGRKEGTRTVLPMQLTHNDLATLIGTSRPTVSLAIAYLEQQKWIARRGRYISIENMDALSQAIAQL